jgi:hypothetical protein
MMCQTYVFFRLYPDVLVLTHACTQKQYSATPLVKLSTGFPGPKGFMIFAMGATSNLTKKSWFQNDLIRSALVIVTFLDANE